MRKDYAFLIKIAVALHEISLSRYFLLSISSLFDKNRSEILANLFTNIEYENEEYYRWYTCGWPSNTNGGS